MRKINSFANDQLNRQWKIIDFSKNYGFDKLHIRDDFYIFVNRLIRDIRLKMEKNAWP